MRLISKLSNLPRRVLNKAIRMIIPASFQNSYSQAGEDAILRFLFNDRKQFVITYLELGTSLPVYGNNTYLFYCHGSRGVCVEANEALIPLIKKTRPKDTVLNVGVSVDDQAEADFYIFNDVGHNTFDREEANRRAAGSGNCKIVRTVKVPLKHVNALIAENFSTYPDLLSIDIEGLDLAVLKSLDFEKYPIPVICAETCVFSENSIRPKDHAIADFLHERGYEVYADTYINTIFVNKKWFYSI